MSVRDLRNDTPASGIDANVVGFGAIRTDEEYDLDNLSEEEQEVVTAEDFITYGRANIEQWDDPEPGDDPIYIEMDALEDNLDQLFALGNISWAHKDVRVGEPIEEYELSEDTTVHLDSDESLKFTAGDTLQTQVVREGEELPDGSGPAEEDSLWLASRIYGRRDPEGSRISDAVRLEAYYGNLDGHSVTVDKREITPTDKGLHVSDVDFLAVTVGTDDMIKNEGSTFGVAAFEALFGTDDAAAAAEASGSTDDGRRLLEDPATYLRSELTMTSILRNVFSKSRERLATEAISTAHEQDIAIEAAAEEVAGDDADEVLQEAEMKVQEVADALEEEGADREQLAADFADEFNMDKEDVFQLFDEIEAAADDEDDEEEDDDMEEEADTSEEADDDGDEEAAGVTEDDVEEMLDNRLDGVVTEDELEEELEDTVSSITESVSEQVDNVSEELGEKVTEELGDMVASEMEVSGTPSPGGSSIDNAEDLKQSAQDWADTTTEEN